MLRRDSVFVPPGRILAVLLRECRYLPETPLSAVLGPAGGLGCFNQNRRGGINPKQLSVVGVESECFDAGINHRVPVSQLFSQTQQPFVVCQSGLRHRPVRVRLHASQVQKGFFACCFGFAASSTSPLPADLHLIHILEVAGRYGSMRLTSFPP